MADANAIARWIVKLEDSPTHPGISKDLGDGAGLTRYGITQKWHSNDVPADFFTTMSNEDAADCAAGVYVKLYCNPLLVAQMNSDDLASAMASFAVNDNVHVAVHTMQTAIGVNPADGAMGPHTVAAINAGDPVAFGNAYRATWTQFYRDDVAQNPSKAQFLNGWINNRVNRKYPN